MQDRRFHRVPIDVPVEVAVGDAQGYGVAKDISLGGMFIETALRAAFGAAVTVKFPVPRRRLPMLLSGTVRWTSERGMGIQFGSLGASETHAITEIERERSSSLPGSP